MTIGLTRDQERACYAYERAAKVQERERRAYKIAVNGLGASVIRSGLAASMAFLERDKDGARLLADLATAGIPGFEGATAETLPGKVRKLPLADYMLATRELLKITLWLKRAVQATFKDDDGA